MADAREDGLFGSDASLPHGRGRGPDFVRFFGPVLDAVKAHDASARPKEVYEWIIDKLGVPDKELQKTNRNGRSNFENKVAFARFYLVKSGYLDGATRGVWALTEKGRNESIDRRRALEIFDEVRGSSKDRSSAETQGGTIEETAPDENVSLSAAVEANADYFNRAQVEAELVALIRAMSNKGFEEFCARILRAIGFENVRTIGGSGDGGLDGVGELLVNRFLRTRIAFQCKRYAESAPITPDKVRDFRGAITGRVDRGIFIATSRFTSAAKVEARRENATPIELVELADLVQILLEEKIGLEERRALQIDNEFFAQYTRR